MCTLIILRRPDHAWPMLVAANRDEMTDRPWEVPGRHWPDRPGVVAGIDRLAGGTWLGLNEYGLTAGILNREGSLGPGQDVRSRGELPLEALYHADAESATEALADIDTSAYRTFNLVIADRRNAFLLSSVDSRSGAENPSRVRVAALPPGLSMITSFERNDPASPRTRTYLPQFEKAPVPDPEAGDWSAWMSLMANRLHDTDAGPSGAMNVVTDWGFGTVSSSLIALPAGGGAGRRARWLFAAGRPDEAPFETVEM